MLTILIILSVVSVVLLTSLIKNVNWDFKSKAAVATLLSVFAAIVAVLMTGGLAGFTSVALFQTFTSVYASSQVIYQFIMKGTTVETKLALSGNKPKGE